MILHMPLLRMWEFGMSPFTAGLVALIKKMK